MAVQLKIPSALRAYTGQKKSLELGGATVREVLKALVTKYPQLTPHLYDEKGALRRYVNIFIDDEDIRMLAGIDSPVHDGATISIIPSVSGG